MKKAVMGLGTAAVIGKPYILPSKAAQALLFLPAVLIVCAVFAMMGTAPLLYEHFLLKYAVSFPGILLTFPLALTLVLLLQNTLLKCVIVGSRPPMTADRTSLWNASMGIFGVLSNAALIIGAGTAYLSGTFVSVAGYTLCGIMALAMLWRLKDTGFRLWDFAQSLTIFLGSACISVNLMSFLHTFSGTAISWGFVIGGTAFLFLEMLAVYILVRTKKKDDLA